jgi:hypothetical protein
MTDAAGRDLGAVLQERISRRRTRSGCAPMRPVTAWSCCSWPVRTEVLAGQIYLVTVVSLIVGNLSARRR